MKRKISLLVCTLLVLSFLLVSGCGQGKSCNEQPKISTYEITCELHDDKLSGKEKVTFYNCYDNSFKILKFNLFGNAFRKDAKFSPVSAQHYSRAYYNGVDYGEMTINKVYSGDLDLEFSICGQDQNVLEVRLNEEIFPEESVTVIIDFELSIAKVLARTGVTNRAINLGNFYPILCAVDENGFYECLYYSVGDPFFSDCADYLVNFTCNSDYVVASSGALLEEKEQNGFKTSRYQAQNVRSFAMVLSKDFKVEQGSSCGVDVKYYYYDDQTPTESLDYALKSIAYFSKTFGEYPYKTYTVVQTGFLQGGMEYPTLVMISDSLEKAERGEVIVHETAHQWWQTVVGNNEIKYGFLDEGLAEYSVVLFYENHSEYGLTREQLIKISEQTFRVFCSVYDKVFGKIDTSMIRSLGEFTTEYEYVNVAYVKPCIMYDTLRKTTGDERFFKALKKYYAEYKFKNVQPEHLVGVFEKIGADSNGFFKSFFDGTAIIWLTNK